MKYNLSEWELQDIVDLLEHSGYSSDDITFADYKHMNRYGQAVFTIGYDDIDGEPGTGRVYVSIKDGRFVAEF
jgi:hypothetical protein